MAFVLEQISAEDIAKYGLRRINKEFFQADADYEWVIDRDRDIYLRHMGSLSREHPEISRFSFYWVGHLFTILFSGNGEGARGGKGSTTWSWEGLSGSDSEKAVFKRLHQEIVADLKEAMAVYKDAGTYSSYSEHTAYFDF